MFREALGKTMTLCSPTEGEQESLVESVQGRESTCKGAGPRRIGGRLGKPGTNIATVE